MRQLFCLICFVVFVTPVWATTPQAVSIEKQDGYVMAVLDNGAQVIITPRPFSSVEVEYKLKNFTNLPSQMLPDGTDTAAFTLVQQNDNSGAVIDAGKVKVEIQKSPFSLRYFYNGELKTQDAAGYFAYPTERGFRFTLNKNEMLYGGGERVLGMDRRGHRMPLYNRAHYGYTTESSQMYYSLPAVMSSKGYAISFDNTAEGELDIGASIQDTLEFSARAGRLAYVVTLGESVRAISQNLVSLSGRQPLPPRWALGNFASRFGYHTQSEVSDTAQAFIDADIPLDGIVLDLYWFGKDVKGHMGKLRWDSDAFPDPDAMIASLKEKHIQTVLITEPFILTNTDNFADAAKSSALATGYNGKPKKFDFYFGNTGLVDIFSESGQEWFWQQYKPLLKQGVSGWWGDLGEPEVHPNDTLHNWQGSVVSAPEIHNAYGHQWAGFLYNRLREAQPEQRPFILMRSGFLGSQRYGMIPWTGDVSRSWGGLKPQVELGLQMSVFGLAYVHSDLGGFAGGEAFDPELYLRWLQFGQYQPVFRPHAQEDIAPEPVFHEEAIQDAARSVIQARYRMLPYNGSLSIENTLTGMPLMRPASFYHKGNKWFTEKDSYYWGRWFYVTPVTEPAVKTWQVNLPAGVWFDYVSDEKVTGGDRLDYPVTMDHIPVFVRAGAIVPTIESAQTTKDAEFSSMTVHVYPDESVPESQYTYYEDDGHSPDSVAKEAILNLDIRLSVKAGKVTLVSSGSGQYEGMAVKRKISWVFHGVKADAQSLTGATLVAGQNDTGLTVVTESDVHTQQQIAFTIQ